MNKIKIFILLFITGITYYGCQEEEYSLGELTAPTNLVISTVIDGQNTANPNGDGSGNVTITATADDALAFKVDFGASPMLNFVPLENGFVAKKYTSLGVNTYTITVIAYGRGGTSTVMTKTISVRSDFTPDPLIVTNLTNGNSKTWVVDKGVPGHLGVGPWAGSRIPEWWAASINEKVNCCNCFYTSTFKFTKSGSNFTLTVTNPDGAFTKTGSLTNLPGIPASGDEGCYPYSGATNAFAFIPTDEVDSSSTNTMLKMGGNNIYIGYGACQDSYEILEITSDYLYLRVRGTETGNAWYLKLKPVS